MQTPNSILPTDRLFIETSAQIIRLFGSKEMRNIINDLVVKAAEFGSSKFVYSEFRSVIGGLYNTVIKALNKLGQPMQVRDVHDLWREIDLVMPYFIPGGFRMLANLGNRIGRDFGKKPISPLELSNYLAGQRDAALKQVYIFRGKDIREHGLLLDKTFCCVWPDYSGKSCSKTPNKACMLRHIVSGERELFFKSINTLAEAKREESGWLKKNRQSLETLSELELMREIGKHPGPFGDILIFCEVPQYWIVLTRDKTFLLLRNAHRSDLKVHLTRFPRNSPKIIEKDCEVLGPKTGPTWTPALIENYSHYNALLSSNLPLGRKRQKITVKSKMFAEHREAIICRTNRENGKFSYGIKFI